MKEKKQFSPADFRAELLKWMPGYKWTVHKRAMIYRSYRQMVATGIKSSGFSRLSTLEVIRRVEDNGSISYEAKSSGYGTRSPWLGTRVGGTLAQALRNLQEYYEHRASLYSGAVGDLQRGRKKVKA